MAAVVRPARLDDVDTLVGIELARFQHDRLSPRAFRRLLASPTASVLVAFAERILGYCVVLFRERSPAARLYSIATAAESPPGTGRLLLAAAEGEAGRRGRTEMRLEVRADNARARSLYEQNGYRPRDTVEGYYADGAAAIRFVKLLIPVPEQP